MAALPQPQHTTLQAVLQWWESRPDEHRAHLGASLIGLACSRRLWYGFRWAARERFSGRVLRLFDTGKREESRVGDELRGIGCEVHMDDGQAQWRVSACGGHFGGSMDGAVLGLPEAPKSWHVLEIKTHSAKSWADLAKKGVKEAKPQHFAQMQTYMHLAGVDRALYYAVNKDTDDLHIERVAYEKAFAEQLVDKAARVISASEPPPRLSEDPAWFECKFCPFHALCHGDALPEVNCRTCAHSTPDMQREGGTWTCTAGTDKPLVTIPLHHQRQAHDCHRFIPALLANLAEPVDSDGDAVTYRTPSGQQFANGPRPGMSSVELRAGGVAAATDPTTQRLLQQFPTAKVTA
jgi:CRISPR/Cas system-associated exonuclease Cas4 (RecB family)